MKKNKIVTDGEIVCINCPYCEAWKDFDINASRNKLNTFELISWEDTKDGENRVSIHKCLKCDTTFKTEWDYNNDR